MRRFWFAGLPDTYREQFRAALWTDAPGLALGVLFIAVGLLGLALYQLRRGHRDRALVWFGLFASVYGARLLIRSQMVPLLIELPPILWAYMSAAITYAIPLPAMAFVHEVFPGWRPAIRWLMIVQAVFAAAGIATDQILRRPESLGVANNILVLGSLAAFAIVLLRRGEPARKAKVLRAGLLVFGFTIVLGNLAAMGVFRMQFDAEPVGFVVFLAAFGSVIGIRAFDNEERLAALQKELEIARRIQATILPREMPRSPNLVVAARYLPMAEVAGDFYDFLIVDRNRLGILIADVSGHGVPAALIASMVKVAIAAQIERAADPAQVLAGMNQILAGKLKGQFVTAAYLFLDLDAGCMRYASAGHPPLLRFSEAEGTVTAISENGIALGLRRGAVYTFTERSVAKGDRFLLYTDGLLEARSATGDLFGDVRLRDHLRIGSSSSPEVFSSSLVDAIGSWAGYPSGRSQDDDLTFVVFDIALQK